MCHFIYKSRYHYFFFLVVAPIFSVFSVFSVFFLTPSSMLDCFRTGMISEIGTLYPHLFSRSVLQMAFWIGILARKFHYTGFRVYCVASFELFGFCFVGTYSYQLSSSWSALQPPSLLMRTSPGTVLLPIYPVRLKLLAMNKRCSSYSCSYLIPAEI